MKAVVLETKGGYCAVLKDDGTIEKVKMTAEVGQEITMPTKKEIRRFPVRYVAAVASFALVALTSGLLSLTQEYSYVSVDVDASVEYSLNRMDRVVRVKGLNKKGEALAKSIRKEGVEGRTFSEAMNKTRNLLEEEGYMSTDDGAILMAVSSKDEKKSTALKQQVEVALDSDSMATSVGEVSLEERKNAQDSGLSTGRYAVVKEIVGNESLDGVAIDIAKSKSASDLIHIAEENLPDTVVQSAVPEQGSQEDTVTEASDEATFDAQKGIDVCEEIHEGDETELKEQIQTGTTELGSGADVSVKITIPKSDVREEKKTSSDEQKEDSESKTQEKKVKEAITDIEEKKAGGSQKSDELQPADSQEMPGAAAPLDADSDRQDRDVKVLVESSEQTQSAPLESQVRQEGQPASVDAAAGNEEVSGDAQNREVGADTGKNTSRDSKEAVTTTKSTKDDTDKKTESIGEVVKDTIRELTN